MVLEHDRDLAAQVRLCIAPIGKAVQAHRAGVGVVEAQQQLGDGRLARTVVAYDSEHLAAFDRERHVAQHGRVWHIGERHVIERERVDAHDGDLFASRRVGNCRAFCIEADDIGDEQARLAKLGNAADQVPHRIGELHRRIPQRHEAAGLERASDEPPREVEVDAHVGDRSRAGSDERERTGDLAEALVGALELVGGGGVIGMRDLVDALDAHVLGVLTLVVEVVEVLKAAHERRDGHVAQHGELRAFRIGDHRDKAAHDDDHDEPRRDERHDRCERRDAHDVAGHAREVLEAFDHALVEHVEGACEVVVELLGVECSQIDDARLVVQAQLNV